MWSIDDVDRMLWRRFWYVPMERHRNWRQRLVLCPLLRLASAAERMWKEGRTSSRPMGSSSGIENYCLVGRCFPSLYECVLSFTVKSLILLIFHLWLMISFFNFYFNHFVYYLSQSSFVKFHFCFGFNGCLHFPVCKDYLLNWWYINWVMHVISGAL